MQIVMDRLILKAPVFGPLVRKATIARWTRTLSTMFAAGVPLVRHSIRWRAPQATTCIYDATKKIQQEISTGVSLTNAMTNVNVFPNMVLQMVSIGEESGAL